MSIAAEHEPNDDSAFLRALDGYLQELAGAGTADLDRWAAGVERGEARARFRREALAEEFLWRIARGEAPALEEFLARLPREEDRKAFQEVVRANQIAERTLPPKFGPGATLGGRYRIRSVLGRGGMSVVFEAHDQELGREVAIKVFNTDARAGTAEEWESIAHGEAAALARLDSPNLVRVHDIRRDKAHTYIVMDLVRGVDLARVLDELSRQEQAGAPASKRPCRLRGLLETARSTTTEAEARALVDRIDDRSWPRTVARLLAPVAAAIDLAHKAGQVHRDLKPNNVLLRPGGDPVVLDFGLSSRVRPMSEDSGALRGTPEYFAPEQARSLKSGSDVRTDVYQLGLVLYEMLTLERAQARGDTEDVLGFLARVSLGQQERIEALPNSIPRSLREICAKALEAAPTKRYASTGQMARDLERFIAGLPNVHATTGRAHATWMRTRWTVTKPAFAALVIGGLALSVGAWMRAEAAGRKFSPVFAALFHAKPGSSEPQPITGEEPVTFSAGSRREVLGVDVAAQSQAWVYALAISGRKIDDPKTLRVRPVRPMRLGEAVATAERPWYQRVDAGEKARLECTWFDGADPVEGFRAMAVTERSPDIEDWLAELDRQVLERGGAAVSYESAIRTFEAMVGPSRGSVSPDQIPLEERREAFRNLVPGQGVKPWSAWDGRLMGLDVLIPVQRE